MSLKTVIETYNLEYKQVLNEDGKWLKIDAVYNIKEQGWNGNNQFGYVTPEGELHFLCLGHNYYTEKGLRYNTLVDPHSANRLADPSNIKYPYVFKIDDKQVTLKELVGGVEITYHKAIDIWKL